MWCDVMWAWVLVGWGPPRCSLCGDYASQCPRLLPEKEVRGLCDSLVGGACVAGLRHAVCGDWHVQGLACAVLKPPACGKQFSGNSHALNCAICMLPAWLVQGRLRRRPAWAAVLQQGGTHSPRPAPGEACLRCSCCPCCACFWLSEAGQDRDRHSPTCPHPCLQILPFNPTFHF